MPPANASTIAPVNLAARALAAVLAAAVIVEGAGAASASERARNSEVAPLERGDAVWTSTLDGLATPSSAVFGSGDTALVADPAAEAVWIVREGVIAGRLPKPPGVSAWSPRQLALGLQGTVLIADSQGRRVDRFRSHAGDAPAWSWVEAIDLAGVNVSPRAVAESGAGLLVADAIGERVVRVLAGTPEEPVVEPIDEDQIPGGWGRPTDLAVAADGRIFVTDSDRHRILRLSPDGAYLGTFGERGPFPGLFQDPVGLDLVRDRVFVADRLNHRISIFDLDGRPQGQWGMHAVIPRQGEGRIHYPVDIAVDADADRAVVVEPFERRVQCFRGGDDARGASGVLAELPSLDGVTSHFGTGIAAHRDLAVLWEPEAAAAVVFDWRDEVPIHVASFGGPGTATDRFGRISAVAIDGVRQRVAIADPGVGRLAFVDLDRDPAEPLRFDPFMGRAAGTISLARIATQAAALLDSPGSDQEPPLLEPVDLAWIDDGGLLALDGKLGRLLVLAPMPAVREGHQPLPTEVVAVWGPEGSDGPRFTDPVAMAISPSADAVAVLDAGRPGDAGRVAILSLDGVPTGGFELPRVLKSLDELPLAAAGLAWTAEGFTISDRLGDRLVLFDDQGVLRHEIGTTGTADGELWLPGGLAVRDDGTVLVVDTGNHRVQGYAAQDGAWRIVFNLGRASTRQRAPRQTGAVE